MDFIRENGETARLIFDSAKVEDDVTLVIVILGGKVIDDFLIKDTLLNKSIELYSIGMMKAFEIVNKGS